MAGGDYSITRFGTLLPGQVKRRIVQPTSSVTRRVSRVVKVATEIKRRSKDDSNEGKVQINLKGLERSISKISTGVTTYLQLQQVIYEWTSVMLVTFIEAYLEEGLMLIATKNSGVMKEADPLNYDTVLAADSIEDLKNEIRRRWANKTVRGGPKNWFIRLGRMGAKGYTEDSRFRLQHL